MQKRTNNPRIFCSTAVIEAVRKPIQNSIKDSTNLEHITKVGAKEMWLLKKTQGKILNLEKKIQTKDNIAIDSSNHIVKVVVEGQRTTFDFRLKPIVW